MKFLARIIQEFTIEAEDEEKAKYAAVYRVARFADKGGSDEKAGKWRARAHDPVLDSLVAEAAVADGNPASVGGGDKSALSQSRKREVDADGVGGDRLQLGFVSESSDSDGGGDSSIDEVDRTGGLF